MALASLFFRDNSTRTRFSLCYCTEYARLASKDLDEGKSQIAHGETVRRNSQHDFILCRMPSVSADDMYLGTGNIYA